MGKERGGQQIYVSQTSVLLELYKQQRVGGDDGQNRDISSLLYTQVCNHLVSAPHHHKFRLQEISDMLEGSIRGNPRWDVKSGEQAFQFLEKYTLNLIEQPWRKEFHKIKLYCGFIQSRIQPYLNGFECFFERLGYARVNPYVFELTSKPQIDDLFMIAFDCLLAQVECNLMQQILKRVEKYSYTVEHVYRCRTEIQGDETQCTTWIKEHCMPLEEEEEDKVETPEISECSTNVKVTQISTAAGSVGGAKPKQISNLNKTTSNAGSKSPSKTRKPPVRNLSNDSGYNGKCKDVYNNSASHSGSSGHSSHNTTPVARTDIAGPTESITAEHLYGYPDIYEAPRDDHYQNTLSVQCKQRLSENSKESKPFLSSFSATDIQRHNSKYGCTEENAYQRLQDACSGGNIYNEIDELRRPGYSSPRYKDTYTPSSPRDLYGSHKYLEREPEVMLPPKKSDCAKSQQNVHVEVHAHYSTVQKPRGLGSSHSNVSERKRTPNQELQTVKPERTDVINTGSSSSAEEAEDNDVLTQLTAEGDTGTIKLNRAAKLLDKLKLETESATVPGYKKANSNGLIGNSKKAPAPPPPVKPKVLRARSVETSGSPPMMTSVQKREGSASAGQSPVTSRSDRLLHMHEQRHKGSLPGIATHQSSNGGSNRRRAVHVFQSATLDPNVPSEIHNPGTVSAIFQADVWQCRACTTFNRKDSPKCDICLSSQQNTETTPGGIACPVCTLINDKNQTKCVLCLSDLKRTSSYV